MRIFDKILCPIDFSQNSVKALQWTEHLAKKFQSKVILLHVMEGYPVNVPPEFGVDYDRYQDMVQANFDEFVSPFRIPFEKMMTTGDPATKIVDLAGRFKASLIVMGTNGTRGAAHKVLGSAAETVVRTTSLPVLTVSPHCHLPKSFEEDRVLVPLASIDHVPHGLLKFRRLLRELNCVPTFLHVIDFQDEMFGASFDANPFLVATHEAKEKAEQLAKIGTVIQKNLDNPCALIQFGSAGSEILKQLETHKYDYAVLGARKRNLLTRFVETNVYQVISQSPVPVITIKND